MRKKILFYQLPSHFTYFNLFCKGLQIFFIAIIVEKTFLHFYQKIRTIPERQENTLICLSLASMINFTNKPVIVILGLTC